MYESFLKTFALTTIDPPMFLVGFVLLALLYKGLEKSFFAPVLEHVEARERATTGALDTAAQIREKSKLLRARYDEKLFEVRVEAARTKAEMLTKARAEASTIIAAAEAEAAAAVKKGRAKIAEDAARSGERVDRESRELARLLTLKVDTELGVQ